jgi:hypothetical protein
MVFAALAGDLRDALERIHGHSDAHGHVTSRVMAACRIAQGILR